MLNDGPKLSGGLLLALSAGVCFMLAYHERGWDGGLRLALVVFGVVVLFFAILSTYNWIQFQANQRYKERQRVDAETAEVRIWRERRELMNLVARLSPDQIEAISRNGVVSRALFGNLGTLIGLPTEFGLVMYDLVDEFMAYSTETHLCPIGRWSEGSRLRRQAEALTKMLIQEGFADYTGVPGRTGPRPPAVWRYPGAKDEAIEMVYGARIRRAEEMRV